MRLMRVAAEAAPVVTWRSTSEPEPLDVDCSLMSAIEISSWNQISLFMGAVVYHSNVFCCASSDVEPNSVRSAPLSGT